MLACNDNRNYQNQPWVLNTYSYYKCREQRGLSSLLLFCSLIFISKKRQKSKLLALFEFIYENHLIHLQSYQLVQHQCDDFLRLIVSFDQPDENYD